MPTSSRIHHVNTEHLSTTPTKEQGLRRCSGYVPSRAAGRGRSTTRTGEAVQPGSSSLQVLAAAVSAGRVVEEGAGGGLQSEAGTRQLIARVPNEGKR